MPFSFPCRRDFWYRLEELSYIIIPDGFMLHFGVSDE